MSFNVLNADRQYSLQEDGEYEVEAIVGHRYDDGNIEFEIQWVGSDEYDFMSEADLANCADLLIEYKAAHDL